MCVDVEMREDDVWGDAEDGAEAVLHQMCERTYTVYIDRHAETHIYACRHAYGHSRMRAQIQSQTWRAVDESSWAGNDFESRRKGLAGSGTQGLPVCWILERSR